MGFSNLSFLREYSVIPQRQPGFYRIRFAVVAGDISANPLLTINRLAEQYGRGEIRATGRQELEIPYVKECDVEMVLGSVQQLGFRASGLIVRPNVVACPGADQCAVAFVKTKKICYDFEVFLRKLSGERDLPPEFRIAISGCPNECSQARINDVGFVGTMGAYGERRLQGFELVVGGSLQGDGRLAERIAFLTSEDLIPTLRDLLDIYRECAPQGTLFSTFFFELGAEEFSRLLQKKLSERMWFFQI